jgi:hypothetical protein
VLFVQGVRRPDDRSDGAAGSGGEGGNPRVRKCAHCPQLYCQGESHSEYQAGRVGPWCSCSRIGCCAMSGSKLCSVGWQDGRWMCRRWSSEETCPIDALSSTDCTWPDLGLNPGPLLMQCGLLWGKLNAMGSREWWARGSVVVKALCYKPEGRGFNSWWGEFLNLHNPSGHTRPWGLLGL